MVDCLGWYPKGCRPFPKGKEVVDRISPQTVVVFSKSTSQNTEITYKKTCDVPDTFSLYSESKMNGREWMIVLEIVKERMKIVEEGV